MQVGVGDPNAAMAAEVTGEGGAAALGIGEESMAEAMKAGAKAGLALLGGEGFPERVAGHAVPLLGDEERFVRFAATACQQVAFNVVTHELGYMDILPVAALALATDEAGAYAIERGHVPTAHFARA